MGFSYEVWVDGELVDPKKIARRTNEVVGPTKQGLRNHGTSRTFCLSGMILIRWCREASTRGPAPERPLNCVVWEDISWSLEESETTAPPVLQKGGLTSQSDTREYHQDDIRDFAMMAAVQLPAEPPEWHQSQPLGIFAATSRQIPIQRKTAAAPTVSAISAMSHPRECSWVNFPLQSQQSCAFLKSPAQSIQRSSIKSKAYQDLLSMSLQMESLKV